MQSTRAQLLTLAFLVAVSALVILYEIAIAQNGTEGTVTKALRWVFKKYPTTFCVMLIWIGIWIGHLWMPCDP